MVSIKIHHRVAYDSRCGDERPPNSSFRSLFCSLHFAANHLFQFPGFMFFYSFFFSYYHFFNFVLYVDLKEIASLIESGSYTKEVRRIVRAVRLTFGLRRKLTVPLLSAFSISRCSLVLWLMPDRPYFFLRIAEIKDLPFNFVAAYMYSCCQLVTAR